MSFRGMAKRTPKLKKDTRLQIVNPIPRENSVSRGDPVQR